MTIQQKQYRLDCECRGTGRIKRYIGHPGRVATFLCFACTSDSEDGADAEKPAAAPID